MRCSRASHPSGMGGTSYRNVLCQDFHQKRLTFLAPGQRLISGIKPRDYREVLNVLGQNMGNGFFPSSGTKILCESSFPDELQTTDGRDGLVQNRSNTTGVRRRFRPTEMPTGPLHAKYTAYAQNRHATPRQLHSWPVAAASSKIEELRRFAIPSRVTRLVYIALWMRACGGQYRIVFARYNSKTADRSNPR